MILSFKVYWQNWPTSRPSTKKDSLKLLAEIDSPISDADAYEADIRPSLLEGGFGLDDFMKENESFFGSGAGGPRSGDDAGNPGAGPLLAIR